MCFGIDMVLIKYFCTIKKNRRTRSVLVFSRDTELLGGVCVYACKYVYVCVYVICVYMCIHSNIYILIDVCILVLYILYICIHNKKKYIYIRENWGEVYFKILAHVIVGLANLRSTGQAGDL